MSGKGASTFRFHSTVTGLKCVDHISRDRLDNRRCNIRPVTDAENIRNQGMSTRNTSGYKGVSLEKRSGKWLASVCYTYSGIRTQKHLGPYTTKEEAARAYDAAAVQRFGQYACTNAMLGLLDC
jgi:hypothetical protein